MFFSLRTEASFECFSTELMKLLPSLQLSPPLAETLKKHRSHLRKQPGHLWCQTTDNRLMFDLQGSIGHMLSIIASSFVHMWQWQTVSSYFFSCAGPRSSPGADSSFFGCRWICLLSTRALVSKSGALLFPSETRLFRSFHSSFSSIAEVAESGVTCSSFLIIHALWKRWQARRGGGGEEEEEEEEDGVKSEEQDGRRRSTEAASLSCLLHLSFYGQQRGSSQPLMA